MKLEDRINLLGGELGKSFNNFKVMVPIVRIWAENTAEINKNGFNHRAKCIIEEEREAR